MNNYKKIDKYQKYYFSFLRAKILSDNFHKKFYTFLTRWRINSDLLVWLFRYFSRESLFLISPSSQCSERTKWNTYLLGHSRLAHLKAPAPAKAGGIGRQAKYWTTVCRLAAESEQEQHLARGRVYEQSSKLQGTLDGTHSLGRLDRLASKRASETPLISPSFRSKYSSGCGTTGSRIRWDRSASRL